jgi:uncharacterized protein YggE
VVDSRELDGVQQLLVDVVAAGANEIQAMSFDVIDKPALRAEARNAAARRKAQLYADAAGVRLARYCTSMTWTPRSSAKAATAVTPRRSANPRLRISPQATWSCPLR